MKMKFFVIITIVLAVSAGLAVAATQGPGGRFGHYHGWMSRGMARALDLTPAQRDQIKGILRAENAKIRPLRQQLRQNEQAQNSKFAATFDEAQVRAFANQQAQINSDLIVEEQRAKAQMFAVLTPDQQQKATQLMQERRQRRQQHMQKQSQPQPQTQTSPGQ